ncbi:hypothetical protein [Spongorhabdus nitratireducens]
MFGFIDKLKFCFLLMLSVFVFEAKSGNVFEDSDLSDLKKDMARWVSENESDLEEVLQGFPNLERLRTNSGLLKKCYEECLSAELLSEGVSKPDYHAGQKKRALSLKADQFLEEMNKPNISKDVTDFEQEFFDIGAKSFESERFLMVIENIVVLIESECSEADCYACDQWQPLLCKLRSLVESGEKISYFQVHALCTQYLCVRDSYEAGFASFEKRVYAQKAMECLISKDFNRMRTEPGAFRAEVRQELAVENRQDVLFLPIQTDAENGGSDYCLLWPTCEEVGFPLLTRILRYNIMPMCIMPQRKRFQCCGLLSASKRFWHDGLHARQSYTNYQNYGLTTDKKQAVIGTLEQGIREAIVDQDVVESVWLLLFHHYYKAGRSLLEKDQVYEASLFGAGARAVSILKHFDIFGDVSETLSVRHLRAACVFLQAVESRLPK